MDNLLIGPDAQFNHLIQVARKSDISGQIREGAQIAPGARWSVDAEGEVEGRFSCGNGTFLSASYTVRRQPRWLALHLDIGTLDLATAEVAGIICRSQAPEAATIRLCLRSALPGGGFSDAFFGKHVLAARNPATHIDLLRIADQPEIIPGPVKRELILFFQPSSTRYMLGDLRLFIV